SPRLQELRSTLSGPQVVAAGTVAASYVALVAAVTPKAAALDARDRQEIERNHQWRLAVDAKVRGPTDPVTQALREDLWSVVTTGGAAAPVGPAPVAAPIVAPPAPPVPNAAQTAFLSAITLTAPASPSDASVAEHPLKFEVRGPANPALP